jgi:hypothetical protein
VWVALSGWRLKRSCPPEEVEAFIIAVGKEGKGFSDTTSPRIFRRFVDEAMDLIGPTPEVMPLAQFKADLEALGFGKR